MEPTTTPKRKSAMARFLGRRTPEEIVMDTHKEMKGSWYAIEIVNLTSRIIFPYELAEKRINRAYDSMGAKKLACIGLAALGVSFGAYNIAKESPEYKTAGIAAVASAGLVAASRHYAEWEEEYARSIRARPAKQPPAPVYFG